MYDEYANQNKDYASGAPEPGPQRRVNDLLNQRCASPYHELVPVLIDVLGQVGALPDPPQFDPAHAQRVCRLVMSDYGASELLPELVRPLRTIAPFEFKLVWHQRRDGDAAHHRMRQLIMQIFNRECQRGV